MGMAASRVRPRVLTRASRRQLMAPHGPASRRAHARSRRLFLTYRLKRRWGVLWDAATMRMPALAHAPALWDAATLYLPTIARSAPAPDKRDAERQTHERRAEKGRNKEYLKDSGVWNQPTTQLPPARRTSAPTSTPAMPANPLTAAMRPYSLADAPTQLLTSPFGPARVGASAWLVSDTTTLRLPALRRAAQTEARRQLPLARLRRFGWLALRIAFSAGLLAYLVVKTDVRALAQVISHADPLWLALGFGVGLLTVVASAWQWQILLKGERITLGLALLTWLYFLGIAFNQLLPSSIGGDVAKIAYVARLSRRGVSAASATVMTRIVGLGAMLLTAAPVAIVAALAAPGFARVGWWMTLLLTLALAAYLMGVGVLLATPALLNRLGVERAVKLPFARKAIDLARSLVAFRHRLPTLFWGFVASAIFYAASDVNFYCYGQSLHMRSPFWFYWVAIPLTALATLAPISLNGYGIRGASFVAIFVLVGESGAAALSLSSLMEIQMLLFALVGAAVFLVFQRRGLHSAAEERGAMSGSQGSGAAPALPRGAAAASIAAVASATATGAINSDNTRIHQS